VDLLTLLFRLPFLPLRGAIKIAQLVQEEAERELYNPASVQRELAEADEARQQRRISDAEVSRLEDEAVGRLTGKET
jgi:hypothetical protein